MTAGAPIWPRSLQGRLFLILSTGLLIAQALLFGAMLIERDQSARAVMLTSLQRDVAVAVALLDSVPADERSRWLPTLNRPTYRFELGAGLKGLAELPPRLKAIADEIRVSLDPRFAARFEAVSGKDERMQGHLSLSDGSALTIDVRPAARPIAPWLPLVLAGQLALVLGCAWLAVRLAVAPLTRFARTAEDQVPGRPAARYPDEGPVEVAQAGRAFNAMQERIAGHLDERVRILAAISHDIQTPITRMRLRVETSPAGPEQEILLRDLDAIQALVREGIAYARSGHDAVEELVRLDLRAFVESIAFDYQDTGSGVAAAGLPDVTALTRPKALRRILTNLIDNALRYAGAAELSVATTESGIAISVGDRGPGIPADQLDAVMLPFVRLENSRNRDTGGTGLGLSIADELAAALGGRLSLRNRDGGGLEATLTLPDARLMESA